MSRGRHFESHSSYETGSEVEFTDLEDFVHVDGYSGFVSHSAESISVNDFRDVWRSANAR